MKRCSKCKIEKDENEFHKDKSRKDGLRFCCQQCQKQYNEEHKGEIKKQKKQYHQEHKKQKNVQSKQYNEEHREEINKYNKQYYQKHKEQKKEYQKQYNVNHKEQISEQKKEYQKERRKIDPCFRLRRNISSSIACIFKVQNSSKRGCSILKYLPYTIQQLKEHLESQFEPWMNWNNHGIYLINGGKKWHIDHIIPHSKLPYDSMSHSNFIKCWSLSNLRPLEAIENIKKGNKIK